ncbi:MAG: hypothetical protein AB7I27_04440 [Bacteriovoracaceae bacterium]
MKKVYILAILLLLGQSSWAQIREFQTTRLMSTAGAGVASILSTEAAILNPAAAAFFESSSFSYQGYSSALKKENALRNTTSSKFPKNSRSQGVFMADHSGPIKGGVGYVTQKENFYDRQRMILHGAAPVGTNSSLGLSYNYVQDRLPSQFNKQHQANHVLTAGLTNIVDENTTLGLVVTDISKALPGEERAIVGVQQKLTQSLILIADAGTEYRRSASKNYLWRASLQANFFDDFFVRVGQFHDNITLFKGTGWGISWIGPRLGVEFAQKYSKQYGQNYIYKDELLVDTSLSAVINL